MVKAVEAGDLEKFGNCLSEYDRQKNKISDGGRTLTSWLDKSSTTMRPESAFAEPAAVVSCSSWLKTRSRKTCWTTSDGFSRMRSAHMAYLFGNVLLTTTAGWPRITRRAKRKTLEKCIGKAPTSR